MSHSTQSGRNAVLRHQRRHFGLGELMTEGGSTAWWFGPELAWQKQAACGKDPEADLFFPDGGRPSGRKKKLCAGCPVRDQCLDHALTHLEQGIWGGLTERERERLLASRLPLHTKEIA